jgi:hypothetical protein
MSVDAPDESNWLVDYLRSEERRLRRLRKVAGEILEEKENGANQLMMEASEGDAQRRLGRQGYLTARYHSWTEGDVWGYANLGEFTHLVLLQCKSTGKPTIGPLEKTSVDALKAFASEQIRRFPGARPRADRKRPLLVSCGYAGYTVDVDKRAPKATLLVAEHLADNAESEAFPESWHQPLITHAKRIHRLGPSSARR